MASSYPGGIDSLPNPATSDSMAVVSHAGQHADANDAIEAIETELGTNPSGASASVKDRLDTLVVGPGSATDNALVRFDGTGGKTVQSSGITVDDSNNVSGVGTLESGAITSSGTLAGTGLGGSLLSAATPVVNGVATAGTSAIPSRQDHVHAIDTTRAALASPTFTGTVTIPSGLVLGTVTHTEGTGSPEGVVSAPVGSTYIDTAATTGAIKWVKASGTGNTGWVVQYGDTGWRNVSSSLQTGWTGKLYVRRQNGVVTIATANADPLTFSAGAAGTVLTGPPTGFGTTYEAIISVRSSTDGAAVRPFLWRSGSSCYYYGSTAGGGSLLFSYTTTTSEAWPSSLPGSAA